MCHSSPLPWKLNGHGIGYLGFSLGEIVTCSAYVQQLQMIVLYYSIKTITDDSEIKGPDWPVEDPVLVLYGL